MRIKISQKNQELTLFVFYKKIKPYLNIFIVFFQK